MAGVENANILEFFRERCVQIAEEHISLKQAQNRIGDHLRQIGYETTAEQRGTIKDISTPIAKTSPSKPTLLWRWDGNIGKNPSAPPRAKPGNSIEPENPTPRATRTRDGAKPPKQ